MVFKLKNNSIIIVNAHHIKNWFKVGLRLNSHIVQNQACRAAVTLRVIQTKVAELVLLKSQNDEMANRLS